jgi:hypothetical protein
VPQDQTGAERESSYIQKAISSISFFLLFVLSGMMLGAGSVLAPRPEAFLAFLVPTGLIHACNDLRIF